MKKIAVLVLAVTIAFILTSCGGSEGTPATSTGTVSPETSGTTASIVMAPVILEVPRPFETSKETPKFFLKALKAKDPILLAFYNDDDSISREVLAEIKIVQEKYQGAATFLVLKSDLNDQTSSLAEQFKVGFIPYMAVLNRKGTIIFEKTGYVDNQVIEQAVYDAVNK